MMFSPEDDPEWPAHGSDLGFPTIEAGVKEKREKS